MVPFIRAGDGRHSSHLTEKQDYTFTDRATYLALKDTLELKSLSRGCNPFKDIYHVITVNPEKYSAVLYDGGKAFADFMVYLIPRH